MQTGAGEVAASRWLDAEDATMQQALMWALEHQPSVAVRLAPALAPWWVTRGRATAGYSLLRTAAEHAEQADDAWPTAQYWLGYLANLAGDFLGALKHYALAIKAIADDPLSPVLVSCLFWPRELPAQPRAYRRGGRGSLRGGGPRTLGRLPGPAKPEP